MGVKTINHIHYSMGTFKGTNSGIRNFKKNIRQVLEGPEGFECNTDDVLVHGKDQVEHDERLEAVLKRLVKSDVTVNLANLVRRGHVPWTHHNLRWNRG